MPSDAFADLDGSLRKVADGLIDQCASRTSGVEATYQQLSSSVAHGQLHGLSRSCCAPAPADPGKLSFR